jgi:hypothetical protein
MSTSPAASAWKTWTALAVVYFAWGSTYPAIRFMVGSLTAVLSASPYYCGACVLLGSPADASRQH